MNSVKKNIKTALTSFGMSSKVFHGPFLKLGNAFEVIKILERTKSESVSMFPDASIVREYDSILEDPEIELVIVNGPNFLHYEMTKQALLANKHVVVEKPFTATYVEALELIKISEERKRILTIYHNFRLKSDFLTVKELLKSQQLGEVWYFETHFNRYRPEIGPKKWKEEKIPASGLVYDIGSHLIDQVFQLFGKPISIDSDIQVQRKNGVTPDYFEFTFHYPNLKARVSASNLVYEVGPRFVLHGEKGSFLKYGEDVQEKNLIAGLMPDSANWGREDSNNFGVLYNENGNSKITSSAGNFGIFYQNLEAVLLNNDELLVSPYEAAETIRIIEDESKKHGF